MIDLDSQDVVTASLNENLAILDNMGGVAADIADLIRKEGWDEDELNSLFSLNTGSTGIVNALTNYSECFDKNSGNNENLLNRAINGFHGVRSVCEATAAAYNADEEDTSFDSEW